MKKYKVGDEVSFDEFEGSGVGWGIIISIEGGIINSRNAGLYDYKLNIYETEQPAWMPKNGRFTTYYFPEKKLTPRYAEIKYDPTQMGDREEDI